MTTQESASSAQEGVSPEPEAASWGDVQTITISRCVGPCNGMYEREHGHFEDPKTGLSLYYNKRLREWHICKKFESDTRAKEEETGPDRNSWAKFKCADLPEGFRQWSCARERKDERTGENEVVWVESFVNLEATTRGSTQPQVEQLQSGGLVLQGSAKLLAELGREVRGSLSSPISIRHSKGVATGWEEAD